MTYTWRPFVFGNINGGIRGRSFMGAGHSHLGNELKQSFSPFTIVLWHTFRTQFGRRILQIIYVPCVCCVDFLTFSVSRRFSKENKNAFSTRLPRSLNIRKYTLGDFKDEINPINEKYRILCLSLRRFFVWARPPMTVYNDAVISVYTVVVVKNLCIPIWYGTVTSYTVLEFPELFP